MSEKLLITAFVLLFSVSALYLFWQNDRELDPNRDKSWWTLSFSSPAETASLAFSIENWSNQEIFEYEISQEKASLHKESVTVKRGEKKDISPAQSAEPGSRTAITVTAGKEKKVIYRQ